MKPAAKKTTIVLAILGALVATIGVSCRATVENRDPTGETFPSVAGESLDGDSVALPLAEPSVLLVGYVQKAQFDADRWLIGLLQATPKARIFEVPAAAGMIPRLISGTIDAGMRSGIPSEDWASVVTLYGSSADAVVEFTGNEKPRNMRVFLLDADGKVVWFHDRGFSASKLLELGEVADGLDHGPRP